MAAPYTIILNGGGLRSLVASALVRGETQKQRLGAIHLVDGRPNGGLRLTHAQRQAEQYRLGGLVELDAPHLFGHGHGRQPDGRPMGALVTAQMLLAGLEHAWLVQAERVVWPGSCGGDARLMAQVTEQIELCDHLADLELEARPRVEAPLLEMTDQQLVELGAQLQVDWTLAWSCLLAGEAPCHACSSCRRRKAAFEKAGLIDPIEEQGSGLKVQGSGQTHRSSS